MTIIAILKTLLRTYQGAKIKMMIFGLILSNCRLWFMEAGPTSAPHVILIL